MFWSQALADRIALPCTLTRGEYNRAWNEVMLPETPEQVMRNLTIFFSEVAHSSAKSLMFTGDLFLLILWCRCLVSQVYVYGPWLGSCTVYHIGYFPTITEIYYFFPNSFFTIKLDDLTVVVRWWYSIFRTTPCRDWKILTLVSQKFSASTNFACRDFFYYTIFYYFFS